MRARTLFLSLKFLNPLLRILLILAKKKKKMKMKKEKNEGEYALSS